MNDITPEWNLWRSFGAVVRHGSLSAAAKSLGLSQPTLGRHVQTLENELGMPLFSRTLRGLEANRDALGLYEKVQGAERALAEATLLAEGRSENLSGTVRITASSVTSHYTLPAMLARIRNDFPAIQIELVPTDSAENLLMRESDIAVRMFRPTQLELVTRKVGESQLVCCAHQNYLERRGTPQEIDQLFSHDLVGLDRSDLLLSVARQMGFELRRSDFALRTDSQTAIWELIRAGLGIGFVQKILVDADPEMVSILPQMQLPALQVWLTTHKELFTSRRIRVIYDALGKLLSECFSTPATPPDTEK